MIVIVKQDTKSKAEIISSLEQSLKDIAGSTITEKINETRAYKAVSFIELAIEELKKEK